MIIDCFMFNGEKEILDIRLNVLDDYVDQFVIVEAQTTFSGQKKPLYYLNHIDRYDKWKNKIKYFVIDENYTDEEIKQAMESPNTEYGKGAKHWVHEFLQKESIKKSLTHLNDEDTVFISDCDEIWNPDTLTKLKDGVYRLHQKMYVYYLNNRSSEDWYGTIVGKYRSIKDACLNHLRTRESEKIENDGWHFSSMGGVDELRRKINNSYTSESNNTSEVQAKLAERYGKEDFLGRPEQRVFALDESGWPEYLKINREKYAPLCSNPVL